MRSFFVVLIAVLLFACYTDPGYDFPLCNVSYPDVFNQEMNGSWTGQGTFLKDDKILQEFPMTMTVSTIGLQATVHAEGLCLQAVDLTVNGCFDHGQGFKEFICQSPIAGCEMVVTTFKNSQITRKATNDSLAVTLEGTMDGCGTNFPIQVIFNGLRQ